MSGLPVGASRQALEACLERPGWTNTHRHSRPGDLGELQGKNRNLARTLDRDGVPGLESGSEGQGRRLGVAIARWRMGASRDFFTRMLKGPAGKQSAIYALLVCGCTTQDTSFITTGRTISTHTKATGIASL